MVATRNLAGIRRCSILEKHAFSSFDNNAQPFELSNQAKIHWALFSYTNRFGVFVSLRTETIITEATA